MNLFTRYRTYILIGVAIILIIGGVIFSLHAIPKAQPSITETTQFQSGNFSFVYPRAYDAKEYASGVVSVGGISGTMFIPLVDIVRYKPNPDAAAPTSFDAFMKGQLAALCGADGGTVSVTCTDPVITPYTNAANVAGKQVSLTLTKKDLATGAVTTSAYGPIYVFETTTAPTATDPVRYQGVFVYPTFSSFLLVGTTSPGFVESLAGTLRIDGK